MREHGISTVGTVALAAIAGLFTAAVLSDWMVVRVETPGPDAVNVTVPFPLIVPKMAANFIPDDVFHDAVVPSEVRQQRDAVMAAVRSLAESPDATFVKVRSEDAHVTVNKKGNELVVAVDADGAVVNCTVPLKGVVKALERWDWQTFDPDLMFNVLGAAGNGNLLTVDADGTHVSITMW